MFTTVLGFVVLCFGIGWARRDIPKSAYWPRWKVVATLCTGIVFLVICLFLARSGESLRMLGFR